MLAVEFVEPAFRHLNLGTYSQLANNKLLGGNVMVVVTAGKFGNRPLIVFIDNLV